MRFIIITGLSGAGKSQSVRVLEDIGYYCIDNMPPALIPKFAEICFGAQRKFDKVAIVCDIRGGALFSQLFDCLAELKAEGYDYEILFLEANDESIVNRYKESRRTHPLDTGGRLSEAIAEERLILKHVKACATYIVDTSDKTASQLRRDIIVLFEPATKTNGLVVNIVSFGFKYGIPLDLDNLLDVRFLPNPFYIPELKKFSGLEKSVSDYVMSFEISRIVLAKYIDLIDTLIPFYVDEGKSQLVVGIGCTGGRHRSVAIAEALFRHLVSSGQRSAITHRDCERYAHKNS